MRQGVQSDEQRPLLLTPRALRPTILAPRWFAVESLCLAQTPGASTRKPVRELRCRMGRIRWYSGE